MKQSWLKDLDPQAESDLRGNYVASKLTRKRLEDLLLLKISSSNTKARSKGSYDNANWAYLQADNVGYERAMHEIIDLIQN